MLTSRDSIVRGIRYFWENVGVNMRNPTWVWDSMIIDVLSPDAAVMTATYHIPHRTPANVAHTLGGAWTAVFRRDGSRWVIVQEHLSDAPEIHGDSAHAHPPP
jgi:ketosteroid isomerase-like protein